MREETGRWLDKAASDLDHAAYLLEDDRAEPAAFHAQQAAEKALKALLIERDGAYPRVHDLVHLAEEAKAPDGLTADCADLTQAYVASRYPDTADPISPEQAERFVAIAKEVIGWTRRTIS